MAEETFSDDVKPGLELSDEDLLQLYTKWKGEAQNFHDALLSVQNENEAYYLGNQTAKNEVPTHKCNAVENRIFMGVETTIPIITANTPQFVAMPTNENKISIGKANSTQELLKIIYESKNVDVREKLKQATRHMMIHRFGVLKPFWDESIDDVNVHSIRPQRIWIPKYGQTTHEMPFVLEKLDMDYQEIKDFAGKAMLEKVKHIAGNEEDDINTEVSRTVTVWECWTNDFVFWKYGSLILKKQENPYFDYEGRKEDTIDDDGNAVVEDVFFNHFRKPRKPYIFLSAYKLGNSIIGDTDIIQQAIPLQDIVNALGRQIVNNANKMGNPAWFIDSAVMEEKIAMQKITNEEGLIIYGDGAANQNNVRRESPPALPNYIPNAKLAAESAMDNIMGTHSTTRGERRQPETLGGRMLLKQSDTQRSGTYVEEIDNAVADLGNWFCQLIKLYYEDQKTIRVYGETGRKYITFSKANIEDGLQVIVKAGSTLQEDELSRRNEAMVLFQNGALDPLTLFERLKFPNPQESAARLAQWKLGKLLPAQEGVPPEMAIKGAANSDFNPQQEFKEGQDSITGGQ